MQKRIIYFLLFLACALISSSVQAKVISGVVRDSISHDPVPYASVMLKNAGWGKLTDANGKFKIEIDNSNSRANDTLVVSTMGYTSKSVRAYFGKKLEILIVPDGIKLSEVVIKPKKEKYSKKNNPAVAFVTSIRNNQNR